MCLIELTTRAIDNFFCSGTSLTPGFCNNANSWFPRTTFIYFPGSSCVWLFKAAMFPWVSLLYTPLFLLIYLFLFYDFDQHLLAKLLTNRECKFSTPFAEFHTTFSVAHCVLLELSTSAVPQMQLAPKRAHYLPCKSVPPIFSFFLAGGDILYQVCQIRKLRSFRPVHHFLPSQSNCSPKPTKSSCILNISKI